MPYSLIRFYGVINENAAKNTGLSENDIELLLDGLWNGTKNLITRSKMGQMPRFLLRVVYKESNFHIGDLDKMIKLKDENKEKISEEKQEKIRDISEIKIDISELIDVLKSYNSENNSKIERIEFQADKRAKFLINGSDLTSDKLKEELKTKINLQENKLTELKL